MSGARENLGMKLWLVRFPCCFFGAMKETPGLDTVREKSENRLQIIIYVKESQHHIEGCCVRHYTCLIRGGTAFSVYFGCCYMLRDRVRIRYTSADKPSQEFSSKSLSTKVFHCHAVSRVVVDHILVGAIVKSRNASYSPLEDGMPIYS